MFIHILKAHSADFLSAGWALSASVFTFDAGKSVVQIAAIELTVYHFFDIRPPEAMFA